MSKLIVISDAGFFAGEADYINELFESGMKLFHLRKPDSEKEEVHKLLKGIDPKWMPFISLHHHHDLMETFGIKRIHFPEKLRYQRKQVEFSDDITVSTSVHDKDGLFTVDSGFHYAFLSPVFKSISKSDYVNPIPESFRVPQEALNVKIYALGGIDRENIGTIFNRGFYGAAVSGAIWENKNSGIELFKELNQICRAYVHTF